MVADEPRSPFEKLRSHYERSELRCNACGHFEEDATWTAETDGSTVEYRHTCPSCGAEVRRTLEARL